MSIQKPNRPIGAATNIAELFSDLDAGMFELVLSQAMSATAAAVVDNGPNGSKVRGGKVTVEFNFEPIKGTQQVSVSNRIAFTKPTSLGKASEETEGTTVLHVGRNGALAITQQQLDLGQNQTQMDLGKRD